jgi:Ser/Thr protein kinase RdoA (MazF antagonist)
VQAEHEHLARRAIEHYGIRPDLMRLRQTGRQVVFEVRAGASHFVLRLYPPHTVSRQVLRSQSLWLRALNSDTLLSLPKPVLNGAGADVTAVRADKAIWYCTLMHWVEGQPRLCPSGPGPSVLRQVGRFMAKLHAHGQTFKPPPTFRCPRWNWLGLFGNSSPWRPVRPLRATRQTQEQFQHITDLARQTMADLGHGPEVFGLIHGDFIQVNYVLYRNRVGAIDFSDFGRGYFLYDMAITLLMLKPFDPQGRQRGAFLKGYREIWVLSAEHANLLDLFIAIRAVTLARWILGSAHPSKTDLTWATTTVRWLHSNGMQLNCKTPKNLRN